MRFHMYNAVHFHECNIKQLFLCCEIYLDNFHYKLYGDTRPCVSTPSDPLFVQYFTCTGQKGTFLSSMGILLDVDWRYEGAFLLLNPPPVQLVSTTNQLRIMIYNYLKDNTFHL